MAALGQTNSQYKYGDPSTDGMFYMGPEPTFRDPMDAMRSMWRRTPEATYPDGYLGTIESTRRDRLLDASIRQNQRSYQRGVHKGERIDPEDYFWPEYFNLETGLVLESQGLKWAPPVSQPIAVDVVRGRANPDLYRKAQESFMGPRGVPRDPAMLRSVDERRAAQLRRLAPSWS